MTYAHSCDGNFQVKFRDAHEKEFVQTFEHAMETLAPVFDRVGTCYKLRLK